MVTAAPAAAAATAAGSEFQKKSNGICARMRTDPRPHLCRLQEGENCLELTCAHLRYLLAVYELSTGEEPAVSSTKIAVQLGVSRPSVTRMLGNLARRELVTKERYGKISLTEQGRAAADDYRRRIQLLTDRIPALGFGLTREELHTAAEALAAVLPERCLMK